MVYVNRFWELDFLRGLAIIMMVIFHLIFDLYYFGGYGFDVNSGFWLVFARVTALIFLTLIGICLTISYNKNSDKIWAKNLKRGLKVFGFGLIITGITWFFFKESFIVFGILHFIGISVILSPIFLRFNRLNLLLAVIFIIFGFYLYSLSFGFPWFVWLGLQPQTFYTFDYFPIFPWFGVVLFGMFLGKTLYTKNKRRFRLKDVSNRPMRLFGFLARHSLVIYLIHQPIIIFVLYTLHIITLPI